MVQEGWMFLREGRAWTTWLRGCFYDYNYTVGVNPRPNAVTVFLSIDIVQRWAARSHPIRIYYRENSVNLWTSTKRTKHKPSWKRETGDFAVVKILTNISLVWPMTHLHQNHLKDSFKMQIHPIQTFWIRMCLWVWQGLSMANAFLPNC